jgi:hypothetical protein
LERKPGNKKIRAQTLHIVRILPLQKMPGKYSARQVTSKYKGKSLHVLYVCGYVLRLVISVVQLNAKTPA